jgi:glutamyl-tRNA(Gln) amidotransferase subunit D
VNRESVKELGRFVKSGRLAFMTSQCIEGRVDLNVYDTGRDLQLHGVVPLEDMLAETALVKAMWALGNSKTIVRAKELMVTDIAGEATVRTFPGRA